MTSRNLDEAAEESPTTADATGEPAPFAPGAAGFEEGENERSLRPHSFQEFVGQRRVVENLRIAIDAARARGDVLEHVLLSGMPGLGKTTLALLISEAMGVGIQVTSGPVIERGKDLLGHLTNLRQGDVFFIDEIHRMSREAEEYLYSAMEDFKVDISLDKGPDARSVRIPVAPFTLVGATTREGLLAAPFRGRFGILEKLEPYDAVDLESIVLRSAGLLGATITPDSSRAIAIRSRGTPRFANRLLRRVRDTAQLRGAAEASRCQSAGATAIDLSAVEEALRRLGIDENGLDGMDRQILEILVQSGERPIGVKTVAFTVGEEERTIEDVYEPYLIQRGLVLKTPRGRLATAKAFDLLGRRASIQNG